MGYYIGVRKLIGNTLEKLSEKKIQHFAGNDFFVSEFSNIPSAKLDSILNPLFRELGLVYDHTNDDYGWVITPEQSYAAAMALMDDDKLVSKKNVPLVVRYDLIEMFIVCYRNGYHISIG